ncbi:MAG TPA: tRNA-modifying protein YgfZ [Plesiomonas shigelloides]|nr:tRNA-modifying protein YgfZ [Plesiomonas shigelloides]
MTASVTAPFAAAPLLPAAQLPLTLMSLEHLALLTITGPDAAKYLQGQVTCDVQALAPEHYTLGAHCDAKGKMWSVFKLFALDGGFGWLQAADLNERQLPELKKYAVFSKLTISEDNNYTLLGLAGTDARQALSALFNRLPDANAPCVSSDHCTLLWQAQPQERFTLLVPHTELSRVLDGLQQAAPSYNNHQQWLALDIEAGVPQLSATTCNEFIPQALNLQALDAVSFSKGCYAGQEMVARAKYRGANKRALYTLAGHGHTAPQAGDSLELQLDENWRRTGTVLAAALLQDGQLRVQAVLNNELDSNAHLRVVGDSGSSLHPVALPYSLE